MATRLTAQYEDLKKSRVDLETLHKDIQDFHQAYAEVAQLQEKLTADRTALEAFGDRLSSFTQSVDQAMAVRGEVERIEGVAGQLAQDYAKLRDISRETREDSLAATEAVKEVGRQLERLAQLQELGETTDEKLRSLNALTEHVNQKVRALDAQKHVVDRAVGETNRLNEMVWNTEAHIDKVSVSVQEAEQRMKAIGVKEQQLAYLPQRFDEFSRSFQTLSDQADELARKQASLETLQE